MTTIPIVNMPAARNKSALMALITFYHLFLLNFNHPFLDISKIYSYLIFDIFHLKIKEQIYELR